mgnify:CR=1 FL=1
MRDEAVAMVEQLGEKIESLITDAQNNERATDWNKKSMLKSDLHHVTMEFKTKLIQLVREL